LTNYFAPILWVVHNFKGDLTNEYGMQMKDNDYLDEALKDQEGFDKETLELNKIRTFYRNLFNDKHCFTIKNIKEQVENLREVVLDIVKVKMISEVAITGRAFIGLVERIIEMLNKNTVNGLRKIRFH